MYCNSSMPQCVEKSRQEENFIYKVYTYFFVCFVCCRLYRIGVLNACSCAWIPYTNWLTGHTNRGIYFKQWSQLGPAGTEIRISSTHSWHWNQNFQVSIWGSHGVNHVLKSRTVSQFIPCLCSFGQKAGAVYTYFLTHQLIILTSHMSNVNTYDIWKEPDMCIQIESNNCKKLQEV